MARRSQGVQGVQGATTAQAGISPPKDKLLGLNVEFDLANSAPAQFHIDTAGGQAVIDLVDMDLSLDGVDVGNGLEIQIPAPDEGLQFAEKGFSPGQIPGAGPRLDEGFHSRSNRHEVRLEEDRNIAVAGIIQFMGAVLAHGDAEQSRDRAFRHISQSGQTAGVLFCLRRKGQSLPQGCVGKPRHCAGHLVEPPDTAEVTKGGQQMGLRLEATQDRHASCQVRFGGCLRLRQESIKGDIRIFQKKPGQDGRVAPDQG